jgi:hypothetical protein
MKVVDGFDINFKCQGQVPEPKVLLKSGSLDLKEIVVCKQEVREIQIKNNSKVSAVFHVDLEKLPTNVEVSPSKGKLGPEEVRNISVRFMSKTETTVKGDVLIYIRGGKTISIPFYAKSIIPNISILETEFNFGNITTLGNAGGQ